MRVQILSFKVRRLNDKTSISLLKNYILSFPNLDILLIQEYKLCNDNAVSLGKYLLDRQKLGLPQRGALDTITPLKAYVQAKGV